MVFGTCKFRGTYLHSLLDDLPVQEEKMWQIEHIDCFMLLHWLSDSLPTEPSNLCEPRSEPLHNNNSKSILSQLYPSSHFHVHLRVGDFQDADRLASHENSGWRRAKEGAEEDSEVLNSLFHYMVCTVAMYQGMGGLHNPVWNQRLKCPNKNLGYNHNLNTQRFDAYNGTCSVHLPPGCALQAKQVPEVFWPPQIG